VQDAVSEQPVAANVVSVAAITERAWFGWPDGCIRRAPRTARTVWAVGIRLSAWPLVVMSAVMLAGLFVIRSLGGAASTLVGEGPEGDDV